jgi:hypothetical protein
MQQLLLLSARRLKAGKTENKREQDKKCAHDEIIPSRD